MSFKAGQLSKKIDSWGKYGLERRLKANSTDYSSEVRFSSQHQHRDSQLSVIPFPGDPTPMTKYQYTQNKNKLIKIECRPS